MMKFLGISGLLLSCALNAAARDPFAAPPPLCVSSAEPLAQWRLLGMVGRDKRYIGWLRSTQGEVVPVVHGSPSPFTGWRIEELTPFRLTLSASSGCVPQRITLQIEGK
ncbi:MAG: HofP DNA utilization family protein [Mixta calida]|nr:HofP DNA utilization family protein [Mixta calida]